MLLLSNLTLYRCCLPNTGKPQFSAKDTATAAAFTNLCKHTLRLRSESDGLRQKVEGLRATVEEREEELLTAGEKIVILQKVVRNCEGDKAPMSIKSEDTWGPLLEKIDQAARASRTKDVLTATAAPFGSRNASCMTEPLGSQPACSQCSSVRTEMSDVAHTIAKFDLADEMLGSTDGESEHRFPILTLPHNIACWGQHGIVWQSQHVPAPVRLSVHSALSVYLYIVPCPSICTQCPVLP